MGSVSYAIINPGAACIDEADDGRLETLNFNLIIQELDPLDGGQVGHESAWLFSLRTLMISSQADLYFGSFLAISL